MTRDRYAEALERVQSAIYSLTFVRNSLTEAFMAVPEGTTESAIGDAVGSAGELDEQLLKIRTRLVDLSGPKAVA